MLFSREACRSYPQAQWHFGLRPRLRLLASRLIPLPHARRPLDFWHHLLPRICGWSSWRQDEFRIRALSFDPKLQTHTLNSKPKTLNPRVGRAGEVQLKPWVSWHWAFLSWGLGLRVLGFRVSGFKDLGFRACEIPVQELLLPSLQPTPNAKAHPKPLKLPKRPYKIH